MDDQLAGVYEEATKAVSALALALPSTDPLAGACSGLASALRLRAARSEMRSALRAPTPRSPQHGRLQRPAAEARLTPVR